MDDAAHYLEDAVGQIPKLKSLAEEGIGPLTDEPRRNRHQHPGGADRRAAPAGCLGAVDEVGPRRAKLRS
jgi:hypothetical protein